ncbi:GDSL esterase/lipase At5g55050-like [Wolffia australiana]
MASTFSSFSFLVLSSLWVLLFCPCHGELAHAIYVFGDSLADVGNNNHIHLTLLKANFPHNGIDYPGRKPTGRYSNGKSFPDFLAEMFGLQTPPPYLSVFKSSSADAAFLKGVSFASGGAGVLDTTNKNQCLPLDKQIQYFSDVKAALQLKLGSLGTAQHLSRSIFVVVIGSNDILNNVDSNQPFVNTMIVKFKSQLKEVYNIGARKILVLGTGPIGCSPSKRAPSKNNECDVEFNKPSMKFNTGVISILREMKTELADFSYSFFDTYAAFMEIISSPSSYGFKEVKAACCGLGDLNAKAPCLPIATYCKNREEYLFWDFYHPTQVAVQILSKKVVDGSPPLVHPLNLRQLASLPA